MDEQKIELYSFRYYDPLRRRWVRARYRARISEIAARYAEYRVEGSPEIRSGSSGQFDPPTLSKLSSGT